MLEWFTPTRQTWLYKVNPALKFVVLFSIMLIILFNQHFTFTLYQFIVFTIICYGFSGFPLWKMGLLTLPILLSFISSTTTLMLFGRGEQIIWSWGIMKISEESIRHAIFLGMKTLCFGVLSLIIVLTSRPTMLIYALMQQFKFPAKYAYSFMASLRMIPIIIEEWQIRRNVLRVRNITFHKSIKGMYSKFQFYFFPILAQSIRRAQRVAVAMEAKQFQMDKHRTYYYVTRYSRMDIFFLSFLFMIYTSIAVMLVLY